MKRLHYAALMTGVACVAQSAALGACGDTFSEAAKAVDSGSNDATASETGPNDAGTLDAPTRTDGATTQTAKIIFVNAATDYGPNDGDGLVRLCFATKSETDTDFATAALPPLPHSVTAGASHAYPGVAIPAGGPLPDMGIALAKRALRPYVMNAKSLSDRGVVGTNGVGAAARCDRLLEPGFVPDGGFAAGAGALENNKDYWQLADIPAGTFDDGKTYLLAIYGCTQDVNNAGAENGGYRNLCGPNLAGTGNYAPNGTPGPGNLRAVVIELDAKTTVAQTELGAQVVNLSPQHAHSVEALPGTIPKFEPLIYDPSVGDASVRYVSASGMEQEVPFVVTPQATPMAKITGFVPSKSHFALSETAFPGDLSNKPSLPIPMNNAAGATPTVQSDTERTMTPSAQELYVNGKTYTFVLAGQLGGDSARRLRFLGFPNVFTPPPLN